MNEFVLFGSYMLLCEHYEAHQAGLFFLQHSLKPGWGGGANLPLIASYPPSFNVICVYKEEGEVSVLSIR